MTQQNEQQQQKLNALDISKVLANAPIEEWGVLFLILKSAYCESRGGALSYFHWLRRCVLGPFYVKPSIKAEMLSVSTCQSFVRSVRGAVE